MSDEGSFSDWVDVYDSLVDWPSRLAREEPFYRRWFQTTGVRRLVDVACGTGHHAAMFHRWQIEVQGADVSPEMIDRARQLHGTSATLQWAVRGFEEPIDAGSPFDAALCVGNSLALAATLEAVERAIRHMLAAVRPGGLVVVHLLNLWSLPDGPCRWQKYFRMAGQRGELLVVKGVHRSGSMGYVDLLVMTDDRPPRLESQSAGLLGLEATDLELAAQSSGATRVEFYGNYDGQPYQRDTSVDLIMVAWRDAEHGDHHGERS